MARMKLSTRAMRSIIAVFSVSLVLSFGLTSCAFADDATAADGSFSGKPYSLGGFTYEMPADWIFADSGSFNFFYAREIGKANGGYATVYAQAFDDGDFDDIALSVFYKALLDEMGAKNAVSRFVRLGDCLALTSECDLKLDDFTYKAHVFSITKNSTSFSIIFINPDGTPEENRSMFDSIVQTISCDDDSIAIPESPAAPNALSGYSFEDLLRLKGMLNMAMWQSKEWQEVTVPQGVWLVGEDIPAGHWSIRAVDKAWIRVQICSALDETGHHPAEESLIDYAFIFSPANSLYREGAKLTTWDCDLSDGQYVIIDDGDSVFAPYTGKPALEFK